MHVRDLSQELGPERGASETRVKKSHAERVRSGGMDLSIHLSRLRLRDLDPRALFCWYVLVALRDASPGAALRTLTSMDERVHLLGSAGQIPQSVQKKVGRKVMAACCLRRSSRQCTSGCFSAGKGQLFGFDRLAGPHSVTASMLRVYDL